MDRPLVSVIVPTHNGARWLSASLGSALRQTYSPTEIIVVDDGSTDATPSLLRQLQPRVTVIRQARGDIGASRNRGIAKFRGEHVAFLDHDDVWRADKLAVQIEYLRRHPQTDVLHADAVEFDEQGTVHDSYSALFPGLRRSDDIFREIVHFNVPLMSTVLIRTAFLKAHGLAFPEGTSGVDDVGLLLEIAARGGVFAYQDEPLARRRLHTQNLSKNHCNRFSRRVVLYSRLLSGPAGVRPEHRRVLQWGLRHAQFRTGEHFWGEGECQFAYPHFRQALGWDHIGAQALIYGTACLLPEWAGRGLRHTKRFLTARTFLTGTRP